jgi:hypothetical protein
MVVFIGDESVRIRVLLWCLKITGEKNINEAKYIPEWTGGNPTKSMGILIYDLLWFILSRPRYRQRLGQREV